jgi:hypothetical protein
LLASRCASTYTPPARHVEHLPSGSFRAVVYAGTDPLTGRPRYLRETAKTYDEAEIARTRLQGQVDEDRHPKTAITLDRAIAQWLEVADLEDTTRERYQDLIRIYISPTLGAVPASKLDAEVLEKFYARLQRCRALCNGRSNGGHVCRPLSSSTVRKIHFIIRAALERAVRWRHLGVNKAAFVVAPPARQTEPDPPNADEAARLLSEAWAVDPDWGLFLWLTMVTGSRRGEMSALRWQHVDFARGLLLVRRSFVRRRRRSSTSAVTVSSSGAAPLASHKLIVNRISTPTAPARFSITHSPSSGLPTDTRRRASSCTRRPPSARTRPRASASRRTSATSATLS